MAIRRRRVRADDKGESSAHDTIAICTAQRAHGEPGRRGLGTMAGFNKSKRRGLRLRRSDVCILLTPS